MNPFFFAIKFVDIVVNGMQDRLFSIKAVGQDPISTDRKTKFVKGIERDLATQELLKLMETELGDAPRTVPEDQLPTNTEEFQLFMQLGYKQGIEIA